MQILESYYLSENETLLFDNKNINYFIAYNVLKQDFEGLGYIDYDTPYDQGESTTEIEILDYFICDDDLKKIGEVSNKDLKIIIEYLETINNF